jgi:DNA invertase Pin-like site-specific DNA recombinase
MHGTARPEFTRAPAALRPGDTLVLWKSDRWGRSAAHVPITIGEPRGRGVTVKSLTENFGLDTKEGRFMFAVLAAAAEYELKLRAERQAQASPPRGERHRRAWPELDDRRASTPATGTAVGRAESAIS